MDGLTSSFAENIYAMTRVIVVSRWPGGSFTKLLIHAHTVSNRDMSCVA